MTDLKSKVEQVKQEIGYKYLSYMSIDLGYAHNYLGRVLSKGLEAKAEAKLIAKLDEFLELHKKELTHDFEGKALNDQVDDVVMVSKSEYDSLNKSINDLNNVNADLFNANSTKDFQINQLKKEIDHKTQIAEKHADMRNKAELRVSELEDKLSLSDLYGSESWNKYLSEKKLNSILTQQKNAISIWLAVSILIIVLMAVFGVLHFNGVV